MNALEDELVANCYLLVVIVVSCECVCMLMK